MTAKQFEERANTKIKKWVKKITCPLCLGIDQTMHQHPTLGPFTVKFSLDDGVRASCNKGHKLAITGFGNPEYTLLIVRGARG